jgi:hypothetical protein
MLIVLFAGVTTGLLHDYSANYYTYEESHSSTVIDKQAVQRSEYVCTSRDDNGVCQYGYYRYWTDYMIYLYDGNEIEVSESEFNSIGIGDPYVYTDSHTARKPGSPEPSLLNIVILPGTVAILVGSVLLVDYGLTRIRRPKSETTETPKHRIDERKLKEASKQGVAKVKTPAQVTTERNDKVVEKDKLVDELIE